jgi:hypothetical protein
MGRRTSVTGKSLRIEEEIKVLSLPGGFGVGIAEVLRVEVATRKRLLEYGVRSANAAQA